MRRWPIGKRIAVTCVLFMAIAIVIGLVGLFSIRKVNKSLTGVATQSLPGVEQLANLQALSLELRGTTFLMGVPGLSADYKTKQLAHLDELKAQVLELLSKYGETISPEERPFYDRLNTSTQSFLAVLTRYRELSTQGKTVEAGGYWSREGGPQSKAFRAAVQGLVDADRSGVSHLVDAASGAAQFATVLTWSLLALAVFGGGAYAFITVRNISSVLARSANEIRLSAEQVVSASAQVTSASRDVAENASQQAASLEQTSASSHQISAMTKQNSENTNAAAELMVQVDGQIQGANQKLEQLVLSMTKIINSSASIAKIIKMIDEIAFQTNILALNAAVEAARAGQEGLGFGVVAEEVRNLARRSTQAAQDITVLIDESVQNAASGNARVAEVADALAGITTDGVRVKQLIDNVSLSAAEQSTGVNHISKSLVQMEQMTQKTAAGAQESASASHELQAQAESMNGIIAELEMLATG